MTFTTVYDANYTCCEKSNCVDGAPEEIDQKKVHDILMLVQADT